MDNLQPCSFCKEPTESGYAAGDGYEKAEPLCEKCMLEVYNQLAPIRKRALAEEKSFRRPDYQKLGRYNKQKREDAS